MKNINKVNHKLTHKKLLDEKNVAKKDQSELQRELTINNMKIKKLKQLLKKEK